VSAAVVGAGPAGMAAAIELARVGVTTHLYDANATPGGQIYRVPPAPLRAPADREAARGARLRAELDAAGAGVVRHPGAVVWGAFDQRTLGVRERDAAVLVRPAALVLATGAYDRPVPIPGWTLPGVYTAGACQVLVKTQGVLPGRRVLVAGTGPLLPVVAAQLAKAGAHVVAVLEAASLRGAWTLLPRVRGQWRLVADAWRVWRDLRTAGLAVRPSRTVARILGAREVQGAVTVRLDAAWRPIPGSEQTVEVDAVCLGFGLVPSIQLGVLCGAEHRYVPDAGGFVPVRSDEMETTVPGIFAAGDGAGIGGARVAVLEGRIAGIAAAARLGALSPAEAAGRLRPHRAALRGARRVAAGLGRLTAIQDGLAELITPDTVVCRCEEVTAAEVAEVLDEGARELAEVKRMTRAGMGLCQGRMCHPALAALLARHTGRRPETLVPLSVRPPITPIPIDVLATLPEA
jgi:D-hydroxyproline dehydrogenase subunit alpha